MLFKNLNYSNIKILVVISLSIYFSLSCETSGAGQDQAKSFNKLIQKMAEGSVEDLTTKELYSHQKNYIILDAREKKEFDVSHIRHAQWLGYENLNQELINQLNRDADIVLYCSVGYRSEKLGEKMQKMGFTKVHNLLGSIFQWSKDGYPLVDHHGQKTDKVHGYNKNWARWLEPENVVLD